MKRAQSSSFQVANQLFFVTRSRQGKIDAVNRTPAFSNQFLCIQHHHYPLPLPQIQQTEPWPNQHSHTHGMPDPAGVGIRRAQPPLFDAVKATAHSLQKLMVDGNLRSTDLVEEYVWRIEKYNGYLRAISEYAPNVMHRAREMDNKRAAGEFLGPLHGIPVLLKVIRAQF
jgi:hypothetical protein